MPCSVSPRAVATGEHVAVYGDYDVDGITAACLLTDYLRFRGLTCELYIPDRIRDGYGLNTAAIDALAEEGVTLIVTVDCGVTNLEETAYAAQRGVDMIVTDPITNAAKRFRRRRRSLTPSSGQQRRRHGTRGRRRGVQARVRHGRRRR